MITDQQIHDMINTGAAALNRNLLAHHGVVAISLAGGRACGKTSLLEATLRGLGDELQMGVIVGNILADRDAERLKRYCNNVATLEAFDITAALVRESLDHLDLSRLDVLFIERSGASAIAGRGYDDVGQNLDVGMLSLSCGGRMAAGNLSRFKHVDLMLLSKIDCYPLVPFEFTALHKCIEGSAAAASIIEISTVTGQGLTRWFSWLRSHVRKPGGFGRLGARLAEAEYYFG